MNGNALLGAATLAIAVAASSPAQADTLLFANDYDNPAYVAPGVTGVATDGDEEVASVGPWNANGWAGNYFVNRSTGNPASASSATLSGLAPNSAVRIGSGILGFLESWDSDNDGSGFSPDYLDIYINGSLVASLTSNNALGSNESYAGATELFDGEQVNSNGYYSDTLVDLSTASFANSFADATGSWTITAQARGAGWQGGSDEAWGLDNLKFYGTIAAAAVPEPASWAMLIAGFGLTGGVLRRTRRQGGLSIA